METTAADVAAEAAEEAALDAVAATADHAKCQKQFVLTVDRNAKCHSSQVKEDLYIAETASQSTKNSRKISDTFIV